MGRVAVASDSASCLPMPLAAEWGIAIAPLQVIMGDVTAVEDAALAPDAVVEALARGERVGTSQPTPGAIEAALAAAAAADVDAVVAVSLSGGLSGTADAWRAGGAGATVPVTVVDSHTVGMAAGLAALSAAAVARAGASADAVAAEAARVSASSLCVFTVDTLEYLRRGGRIGAAQAVVGDALGVRPVLEVVQGRLEPVARVRSTAKARADVVERVIAHAAGLEHPVIAVMSLPGDAAAADAAATAVRERSEAAGRSAAAHGGAAVVMTAPLSAVLAAHAGPGTLAIAVADVDPRLAASLA